MFDLNDYIGKPYAIDGGDGINTFNCATLYRAVTGIDATIIPTCQSGSRIEIIKAIRENKKHYNILTEPKEGCIVALSQLRNPHHVGVWVSGGVLHCLEKVGVIFSTLDNLKLNGYTWEFGELKNG